MKDHFYNEICYDTQPWRQKIAVLIRMQFLNDIIKLRHGFKTAQKFHKFRVLIKIKVMKLCIRLRIKVFGALIQVIFTHLVL